MYLEEVDPLLEHVLLPLWQLIEFLFGHPKHGLELLVREIGLKIGLERTYKSKLFYLNKGIQ